MFGEASRSVTILLRRDDDLHELAMGGNARHANGRAGGRAQASRRRNEKFADYPHSKMSPSGETFVHAPELALAPRYVMLLMFRAVEYSRRAEDPCDERS